MAVPGEMDCGQPDRFAAVVSLVLRSIPVFQFMPMLNDNKDYIFFCDYLSLERIGKRTCR